MGRRGTLELLRDYESRNVTYIDPDGSWPIVWKRAKGVNVWDESGRKYLDLTAAFGVAAAGHSNPRVIAAAKSQMDQLLHAMGDVHPHRAKAELACRLSELTFGRWGAGTGKSIFTNSGFESVEAALKTALLKTGKSRVLAFEGSYHGLGYGALNVTHREHFKNPFRTQLREFTDFVPFPKSLEDLPNLQQKIFRLLKKKQIGAILVEPVQARGGINVPPRGFLQMLRTICDESQTLLVLDEIYTGFGRTGEWFACEHEKVVPDLICLGKALTGGFPLSVCIGKADLMDEAWPPSTGEAIHTSTYLGHPVGCRMALAQIEELHTRNLITASRQKGAYLLQRLHQLESSRKIQIIARGLGLIAGIELRDSRGNPATDVSLGIIKRLLHRGFIFLPEGEHANVISWTPPLTISRSQLDRSVQALQEELP